MANCKHSLVGSPWDPITCEKCGESLMDIQAEQIRELKTKVEELEMEIESLHRDMAGEWI